VNVRPGNLRKRKKKTSLNNNINKIPCTMAAFSSELRLHPEALLGPIAFPYKIFDLSHTQMHQISYRQS
jgi:hypothetical protein